MTTAAPFASDRLIATAPVDQRYWAMLFGKLSFASKRGALGVLVSDGGVAFALELVDGEWSVCEAARPGAALISRSTLDSLVRGRVRSLSLYQDTAGVRYAAP